MYFATQTSPVTPMFFMHFSGSNGIYDYIESRLEGVKPAWVLYTGTSFDYTGFQAKSLEGFADVTSGDEYECFAASFDKNTMLAYKPTPVYALANPIDICKRLSR